MPELVATRAALAAAAEALAAGTGPVAVDAERASSFRYGQRAYLVQLRRAVLRHEVVWKCNPLRAQLR